MDDKRAIRRQKEVDAIKKSHTDAIVAPKGSFTNYRPVPGRKGFWVDDFGHLKYIPELHY